MMGGGFMRFLKFSFLVLFLSAFAALLPTSRAQKSASFEKTVQPFLVEHCAACHDAKTNSGGLNLSLFTTASSVTKARESWEHIVQRVQAGEMPPKGMPRPDKAEVDAFIAWVEGEITRADKLVKPDPGRVTARRLNRTEYNNTVRDLLGVDLEPANDFPQDDSAHGFDNIADALSLSPTLMEKYLAAAEKIARQAVFGPDVKVQTFRIEPTRPRRMETNPVQITQEPFYTMHDYDTTGISHPGSYHFSYYFPATGEYQFRVRADGAKPPGSEPQMLDLYVDGKVVKSFEVIRKVTATNEVLPTFMEVRLPVTAGKHQLIATFPRLFDGLPVSFNGPNPSKLPQPPPPDPAKFFPPLPADATLEQKKQREAQIERFRNRKPTFGGIAIAEVEINGPFNGVKGAARASLEKLYTCSHVNGAHQPTCIRKIVGDLAHRAFRRPVEAQEVDGLLEIHNKALQRGRSFEQGLALAVQTVLVAPDFLFRIEKERNLPGVATSYRISAHELAARLSYFLWSSMPDEELLRVADTGALLKPVTLTAQVRRMLKDPKASALAENFAGQWLEIRRLESVKPDRDRFPDFDDYLRISMLKETELFFQNIAQQDRSILEFIDGNYTFLNERLARHYGIKGVHGSEFRKVDLTGTGRSGILTQASVLTVSSYGNRTSPVLRGKWILENLLNTPPPPAPANVPPLDEKAVGSTASLRVQMEQHRQNPVCASCHAKMDPLGFALENYDAVGAWRTKDGNFPIDASGALPNGKAINGPTDLLNVLKADRKAFTEALAEKLLTYALGRGVARHDRAAVKTIAAQVTVNQFRFSSLVLEIVRSLPFQQRTPEPRVATQRAYTASSRQHLFASK
jgi:mono/diheme cytochrome c family protein